MHVLTASRDQVSIEDFLRVVNAAHDTDLAETLKDCQVCVCVCVCVHVNVSVHVLHLLQTWLGR